MGILLPVPKALVVTLRPGGTCFLLYSFLFTALATQLTVSALKPKSMISTAERPSST